ncbi:MAG: DUF4332 domain-containing protein [Calditrichaceae bacterium]
MSYSIDPIKVSLNDLQNRIEDTNLVPSRASLLDGIENKFKLLKQYGIKTFADLRKEIKNAKNIPSFSSKTGIDVNYLTLLRREIESYFPKPSKLKEFNWMPKDEIGKLESNGIKDTASLHHAAYDAKNAADLARSKNVDSEFMETMIKLADLCRVQWVSLITARMLVEAGYDSASALAAADSKILCNALMQVNKGGRFYKGNIGLRDIQRLIKAAGYFSD